MSASKAGEGECGEVSARNRSGCRFHDMKAEDIVNGSEHDAPLSRTKKGKNILTKLVRSMALWCSIRDEYLKSW